MLGWDRAGLGIEALVRVEHGDARQRDADAASSAVADAYVRYVDVYLDAS